jgi:hypothetical protein
MTPTNKVSDKPSRISPLTHSVDVNMPAIVILPGIVHLMLSRDKHWERNNVPLRPRRGPGTARPLAGLES